MANKDSVTVAFDQHSPEYTKNFADLTRKTRETCPVAWSENYGGYWVITDIDVASEVLRRHDEFSAFKDVEDGAVNGYQGIQIPNPAPHSRAGFLELDPPQQLDYRRVLNSYLSPATVTHWQTLVREMSSACINSKIASGEIDFVDDLANVVPAVLTMAMLGLPLRDWTIYSEPTHGIVNTPVASPEFPSILAAYENMHISFAREVEKARTQPRPGIIKALVEAEVNGAPLDSGGIVATISLLIGGGFDTTTALTANSLHWLAKNRQHLPMLANDDKALDLATEEFLRFFSPSQGDARTTTKNTEVHGYQFEEGDRVLCSFSMVNRDPKAFDDPDELKVDRFPNRHAAFGLGNHRCIGSNTARMQFKGMFSEVIRRIPDFEINESGVVRYETTGVINGYKHLPAKFTPGKPNGEMIDEAIDRWQKKLDDEAKEAK